MTMSNDRRIARRVGVFFIVATVAGILSLSFTGSILDTPNDLTSIAEHEIQVLTGSFFVLIMAVAVTAIPIAAYPILRRYSESIAIGYFGARVVEAVIFIIDVLSVLVLLSLSRAFLDAGSNDAAYFHTLGELLLAVRDWGGHVILSIAVFPLGAMMFYYLLYQAKLVPRWLSGWGIIGAVLYLLAGILIFFTLVEPYSTVQIILSIPLAVQEMVLAVWLIAKGFHTVSKEHTN
ncbi:protein of unknown function [Evansella caseinilytica]|uniref:DUF4386 domain-containing protein n=1 Tax=Evansella caseinilytica TaxID=1503961 RepID=A0A1H3USN3_9BACI|nr:DUF4386 domain-containing protein [Evansella caseinilytica]SDZ65246.1 protein of unknown function [Evansella caseinilytica]